MTDAQTSPAAPTMTPENQRLWATLIHLGWIAGGVVGMPFLPAIIGYIVCKDRGAYIRQHTAAALNFQISWFIWGLAIGVLSFITFGIAALLFLPYSIAYIVFTIIDAVRANKGQTPGQSLSIPFVS